MSEAQPGSRLGKAMMICAWLAGIGLATHFFGLWEQRQHNPNVQPQSLHGDGFVELRLLSNRQGHYVFDGLIDGTPATFLLDTGASAVAVPETLAQRLQLKRGAPVDLDTANGRTQGWRTRLQRLELGDILLHDVPALIAPGMDGNEVLLGMSALKQLEFSQRDGTLVLRQNISP